MKTLTTQSLRGLRLVRRRAQGAVEYILIVGLISLLIFAAVRLLGNNVNDAFNKAASDMEDVNNSST